MNERMKRLHNLRAKSWEDYKSLRDSHGDSPTAEQVQAQERALAAVEDADAAIGREERAAAVGERAVTPETREVPPVVTDQDPATANDEYRDAFSRYLRSGLGTMPVDQVARLERGFVEDSRAQAVSADAAGGYIVPETFLARMTDAMRAFGGILAEAEVLNTATGNPLRWPTSDDTNNVGAILAENTQVGEQDFVFGSADLGAHMYTSKMVRVSRQLLQDSAFNLEVWLPAKLGQRIGRALAQHLVDGNGTTQPEGLLTGLNAGAISTTGAALAFDDLFTLEHSIDPAYRAGAKYILSDTGLLAARKLKDTQGQYLWAPAVAGGTPSTINGRPYVIDNNMPVSAAGAAVAAFGNFKEAYVVRQVAGAQTLRLTERYADFLQVGFLGFARFDATVQNAAAAKVLKIKAAA